MKKRTLLLMACACIAFLSATRTSAQKTTKLFNGKDLSNWNFVVDKDAAPAEQVFSVKNGVIHISGQPFGYMYSKKEYGDFQIHAEWRWPGEKANSGIFLLIEKVENPFPNGIECQLMAGSAGDFVLLNGSNLLEYESPKGMPRPQFPIVKKNRPSNEKPTGEWNEANIFCKNGVITVFINGEYQNTGTNPNKKGYIALQSEGGAVEFRNVTITE